MKLLYGYFDEETGKSKVAVVDRYGTYTGEAKLHPDDRDNASKFAGCRIAELRAQIKMLIYRRRRIKIKISTIKEIIKDINVFANSYVDIERRLYIKLKYYTKERDNLTEQIEELKKAIIDRIQMRDKILHKKNAVD